MSRRENIENAAPYAILLIGLLVIAITGWSYWYNKGFYAASIEIENNAAIERNNSNNLAACEREQSIAASLNCTRRYLQESNKHSLEFLNFLTQSRMEKLAEYSLVVSFFGLLVAAIGAFFVVQTLTETRNSVIEAQRANHLTASSRRPWVTFAQRALISIRKF